jgi:hypothetical protein
MCSQNTLLPSGSFDCSVSPSKGLKGFNWPVHTCIPAIEYATIFLNRSILSVHFAALFKKIGAKQK